MPGTLIIDACPATFHVIDGQHRLFGYTGVKKKLNGVGIRDTHRVLVTAFENLNVEEEADVFLEVNTNAKPIKPGLVMEIEFSTERVFRRNLATSVVFKLREGKNREIRNIFESINMTVTRLIRISYGPYKLGKLQKGKLKKVNLIG